MTSHGREVEGLEPSDRQSGRAFLRLPTPADLVEIGMRDHLELTEDEAEDLAVPVAELLRTIEGLRVLRPLEVDPSPYTARDPGRRPDARDDPWNAFTRMCDVPGAQAGPLAGKTVGVKDNIDVAGIPTTNASLTPSYTPTRDSIVVERILAAGGRIVGKLNMDDFGAGASGETSAYGPPLNPRDVSRSPGGSSGGSGSAVASGAVDLALGVDQAGSARIPAAFCGVVAIKATHGLVPTQGVTHLDHTIDSVCPMARTVNDAVTLLEVVAGDDWRDPQWVRGVLPSRWRCSDGQNVEGMKVGIVAQSIEDHICSEDVRTNVLKSGDYLKAAGASVEVISVPIWPYGLPIIQTLLCHLVGSMIKSEGVGYGHLGLIDIDRMHAFAMVRRHESRLFPPYMKVWMLVERYLHDEYLNVTYGMLQNLRLRLRRDIDEVLNRVDLLLTPTTPDTAPVLLDEDKLVSSGVMSHILKRLPFNTAPLNLSGHPVVALPSGAGGDGLPTSIQLVARRLEEETAVQAARVVEAALA